MRARTRRSTGPGATSGTKERDDGTAEGSARPPGGGPRVLEPAPALDRARARRRSPLLGEGALLPRSRPAGARARATPSAGSLVQALVFAGGIAVLRRRRPAFQGSSRARRSGASAALGRRAGRRAGVRRDAGAGEGLWAGAAVGLLLLALRGAVALLACSLGRAAGPCRAGPLLRCLGHAHRCAARGAARRPPPAARRRRRRRAALAPGDARGAGAPGGSVPGAAKAYWWQGQLHVLDADRLRRTAPLPPKTPGSSGRRVGDSLTYGDGVAAEEAWPAVLEGVLRRESASRS